MVRVTGEIRIGLILRDANNVDVWEGELTGSGIGTAGGGGIPGNGIKQALGAAFTDAIGKLGGVLEAERPWEQLGKARPAAIAAAPARATVEEPAPPVPGWSDVDQVPSARAKRKGHAVIIGIERYRTKLPLADFAAGDAVLMGKYATAVLGYPEENVVVLSNDAAAKSDFDKYFDKWLPNRVEKDDEVLVYFSGHGSPNATTGDAFLVPYDGDPTYLEETGYPLAKLYAALGKLPTKKTTVVLDSCFSGAGGRSVLAKGARPLVAVKTAEAGAGITVIAASSSDQISNSYQEKGHGLFTYFFLKGLKEKGSDLKAAFEYLKPEVAKVARRQYNTEQEPQWREGR
ncbi:MAG: caspase family protein [Elusimicrobia bacterium]|nr:caspase family protein [Elusimicrobiota bacterium]